MKKKLYYILAASAVMMALSACSLKEDDNFGTPASQRAEEYMNDVNQVLASAPNGWLMEYYGNLNFGGYNVMVKFDGDQATVASEKWGPSHKAGLDADGKCITTTSHFKVEQSMGSILSFDEYNETFHYYSMPNNPDYSYDVDEGLLGDFEFRIMKASADSIILRGKKHNNRIVMTPIPADRTWESIISEADATEKYMQSRSYTLSGEAYQDSVDITATNNGNYRCLVFSYTDSLQQKQTVAAPYIVKDDGYYFYNKVVVNGVELDGLLKGTTDDYFVFRNNDQLQLDSYMPTLYESLTTGVWYMTYASLGTYAQPKWDAMLDNLKTAGKNKDEVKIYTATIGLTSEGKVAFSMLTTTDAPYWGYTPSSSNGGTGISFVSKSSVSNKAGKDYYNKLGWKNALEPILGHSFKLSCDNQRRPTYITLTDKSNADNVITVYATPTYFMDSSYYLDD